MKTRKKVAKTIGRRDLVDLPELGLFDIDAKIDTGANTSALHVKKIRVIEEEGKSWIKFRLAHPNHPAYNNKEIKLEMHAYRAIKNSFGQIEERYIIKTSIILFGKNYVAEFSLTDRSKMECPVLLGRKLLYRKFIVDVTQKNLSYSRKQKRKIGK